MWTIYPLDLGICGVDRSENTFRAHIGEIADARFLAYYITDGKTKCMIEGGLPDPEWSKKYHGYTRPQISDEQRLENQLAKRGVKPEEIEYVFLTHLHWDHAMGLEKFVNAKIFVSNTELTYAVDPLPCHWGGYESPAMGLTPPFLKVMPQIQTVPMEKKEIIPGITMFPTPGHTIGSMSIAVETADGPYVFAGDAVACYENLQGNPAKNQKYLMLGIFVDMFAAWKSFDDIMEMANGKMDHVFPGHEKAILEHDHYPMEK